VIKIFISSSSRILGEKTKPTSNLQRGGAYEGKKNDGIWGTHAYGFRFSYAGGFPTRILKSSAQGAVVEVFKFLAPWPLVQLVQ
jgi:hypothetical protein